LINQGAIGQPVAATAFMMGHGPETWHPDPDFYYQVGGGPMYDMGPYYLTALIALLGPVDRVTGVTSRGQKERVITSQPKYGTTIQVNTPTHVTGLLDFASGAVGTIITSFDVWAHNLPHIEIHGTEGSLSVPDPNGFGGEVRLRKAGEHDWSAIPLTHTYTGNTRGLGVADMAYASRSGRAHRASGALAYHVLDIMDALHESSQVRQHIELSSQCLRPEPLTGELLWEAE
jgi:predicted dehydrogenase